MSGVSRPAPALRQRMVAWWRGLVGFGNGVLGADRYERYLQYHRATGSDQAPMTEREFWRDYQDWQDAHSEGRCC